MSTVKVRSCTPNDWGLRVAVFTVQRAGEEVALALRPAPVRDVFDRAREMGAESVVFLEGTPTGWAFRGRHKVYARGSPRV